MGIHENINFDSFPKQGKLVGKRVRVCFNYDTSRIIRGTIVRDDLEEPGELIIKLDDGRYVRAVECMYSYEREEQSMTLDDTWISVRSRKPPEGVLVWTKIDDQGEIRDMQKLIYEKKLWWFSNRAMYLYCTPTHWKHLS